MDMQDHFADRLIAAVQAKNNPLMVGLDPRPDRLPFDFEPKSSLDATADAFEYFCKGIIDVVAPLVACVKPQSAFFEMLGPVGMSALWNVIQYAKSKDLLVVLDAKRGDIGSTAAAYASAFLGDRSTASVWGCDAVTVNPFLGDDSLSPFVECCKATGNGIFVLVRTSNPGGRMLQELISDGRSVYEVIGGHVQGLSNATIGRFGYGLVGAVVGATHREQLAQLREQMPESIFLVPGFGVQGGTARDVAAAFDERGLGAIVNSSRAIIFAHERPECANQSGSWQRAVEAATLDAIAAIRSETAAGNL